MFPTGSQATEGFSPWWTSCFQIPLSTNPCSLLPPPPLQLPLASGNLIISHHYTLLPPKKKQPARTDVPVTAPALTCPPRTLFYHFVICNNPTPPLLLALRLNFLSLQITAGEADGFGQGPPYPIMLEPTSKLWYWGLSSCRAGTRWRGKARRGGPLILAP